MGVGGLVTPGTSLLAVEASQGGQGAWAGLKSPLGGLSAGYKLMPQ